MTCPAGGSSLLLSAMRTTQMILLLMTACAATACAAQSDDHDDRTAADSIDRVEPSADIKESVPSLRPATTCASNCDCTLGNVCSHGICTGIDVFSPPPPKPPCAADCQCPSATPFC